ncbi:hypothetical protein [Pseudobutyrivibrio sp.]|uniref:hypothetical protein n=1 Tax=Pseudobutyrivibrio sp. TaxID=2014367 RepID=UPI001B77522E|nr:hypothetical protein [Pseudobutyrivibrio sp.]MBP3263122.1 hypothetical protein [Pseudobutyrivibrio sp.]
MLVSKRNDDVELIETISNDAVFLRIDRETAALMGKFTDIRLTKKDKEDQYNMCKAVEEIKAKSIAEGIVKGETKGTLDTLISLVRDGLLDIEEAAKRANMQLKDFEEKVNSNDNN